MLIQNLNFRQIIRRSIFPRLIVETKSIQNNHLDQINKNLNNNAKYIMDKYSLTKFNSLINIMCLVFDLVEENSFYLIEICPLEEI